MYSFKKNRQFVQKSFFYLILIAQFLFYFENLWAASRKNRTTKDFYKKNEVRVIRERFFQKKYRLELGLYGGGVMNSSFTNSLTGSLAVAFHLNEYVGLEVLGSLATTSFNYDYDSLFNEFRIFPQIIESENYFAMNMLFTPVYGKAISVPGIIAYFDTFIAIGGGMGNLGVTKPVNEGSEAHQKGLSNVQYSYLIPLLNFAGGQRVFLNRKFSLKWMLSDAMYLYPGYKLDSHVEKQRDGYVQDTEYSFFHNLTLLVGLSYFF